MQVAIDVELSAVPEARHIEQVRSVARNLSDNGESVHVTVSSDIPRSVVAVFSMPKVSSWLKRRKVAAASRTADDGIAPRRAFQRAQSAGTSGGRVGVKQRREDGPVSGNGFLPPRPLLAGAGSAMVHALFDRITR